MLLLLLLLFLLLEFAAFALIASQVGLVISLALIFGTSFAGLAILFLRFNLSRQKLKQFVDDQLAGVNLNRPLVFVLFAVLLLIIPGFITDAISLLVFARALILYSGFGSTKQDKILEHPDYDDEISLFDNDGNDDNRRDAKHMR